MNKEREIQMLAEFARAAKAAGADYLGEALDELAPFVQHVIYSDFPGQMAPRNMQDASRDALNERAEREREIEELAQKERALLISIRDREQRLSHANRKLADIHTELSRLANLTAA